MSPSEDDRDSAARGTARRATPGLGRTQASRNEVAGPQLPSERDESADSQQRTPEADADIGKQAWRDLDRGLQDTGHRPVTDAAYERLRDDAEEPKERR